MHTEKQIASMQWLRREHHWADFSGPDLFDFSPTGRQAVIKFLERICSAMHKRGARGDWTYSLPLHAEHARILDAERAALAAAEPSRIAA